MAVINTTHRTYVDVYSGSIISETHTFPFKLRHKPIRDHLAIYSERYLPANPNWSRVSSQRYFKPFVYETNQAQRILRAEAHLASTLEISGYAQENKLQIVENYYRVLRDEGINQAVEYCNEFFENVSNDLDSNTTEANNIDAVQHPPNEIESLENKPPNSSD